jgi:hypothetical protein
MAASGQEQREKNAAGRERAELLCEEEDRDKEVAAREKWGVGVENCHVQGKGSVFINPRVRVP